MPDDKYVVFKISDWLDQRQEINKVSNNIGTANGHFLDDALSALDAARLDDAVVIRRQDMFSPPTLDSYSNTALVFVEALQTVRDLLHDGGAAEAVDEMIRNQQKRADYFHEQAALAWDAQRKLPD